ncbi:class I SAM-dependent methyltransferase [Mycobacterium sherrisii]|uniref:class I SAM-dependent methyltransferase n=1 Tax=Mycobacterium sherrisii TaxID=243061 RepID=UPI000A153ED6|nr:class I SAM-dependent methyltransferase [Mycobacterium sherrisii]MCV7032238.1 class I SAM-dependent methyltransferase [Mycobacterium sherrisii]ORW74507.1 hypothetical protein AWC25_16155 [Mycobacterium sherrisii]
MTTTEYDSDQPGFETVDDCERCLLLLDACTGAIVSALGDDLGSQPNVVDLGCGVGEPGLSLVKTHHDWHLTGIDLSRALIAAARQHAQEQDLTDRTTFVTGSMDRLPIDDGTVDAVISRMGALLLGNPATTAREMARILEPGGRFALAVWARAEDHPLLTLSHRAITTHVAADLLPDLFTWFQQMAAPGVREGWLRAAGMSDVVVDTFDWVVHYPDFDSSWELAWSIWSGSLADLDELTVTRIRSTLHELLGQYESRFGDGHNIPATCQMIYGTR